MSQSHACLSTLSIHAGAGADAQGAAHLPIDYTTFGFAATATSPPGASMGSREHLAPVAGDLLGDLQQALQV